MNAASPEWTPETQWSAVQELFAGLAAAGAAHVVVAPGSRSTPLALAAQRNPGLAVTVVGDERSAAFVALGIGRATGCPAVVVCTSGSALAHVHPAVLEAHHGRVPLVVVSADRPPELLDTGAGQTIDQTHLFGGAVRWFGATGVADAASRPAFGPIGVRAASVARGPVPGPVHVNVAVREPLLAASRSEPAPRAARPVVVVDAPTIADATIDAVMDLLGGVERGVVVAGWGSRATGGVIAELAKVLDWPLLADPVSNARVGKHAVSTYEALVRDDRFADEHVPEVVLRFGAPLTSKATNQWLRRAGRRVVVDREHAWLDPHRDTDVRVVGDAGQLASRIALRLAGGGFRAPNAAPSRWMAEWRDAERRARSSIDRVLDADEVLFDGRIARDVVAGMPDGSQLLVASSLAVRDLEWFAAPRSGVAVHANRGVNGIDGLVSTAAGIAAGSEAPTVALLGDLALLHDSNGLLGLDARDVDLTFIVIDNDGGGIFSFLPQADVLEPDEFDRLFGTPHGRDLTRLFDFHDIDVVAPTTASEFAVALRHALDSGGVRAIVVRTDRTANVERHRALWDAARSRR